jgi:glycosyltransferase involved in cell wall biosynthesis
MPMYNVQSYVGEAVASVLGSTFRDLELILVDDGSTDDTVSRARDAAADDPRVQVVSQANGGAGAARNAGLARAVGEYVTFADADDIVEPKHFERAVTVLDRTGSDFCVAGHRRLARTGELLPGFGRQLYASQRLGITVDDHPEMMSAISASAKVYRRSFTSSIGLRFDEGSVNEDQVPSALSYVSARAFDVITQPAFQYRMRQSNDSTMNQRFTGRFGHDLGSALSRASRLVKELGGPRLHELFVARALAGRVVFPEDGLADPDTTDYLASIRQVVAALWGELSPAARAQLSYPGKRAALYLAATGSPDELAGYLAAGGLDKLNWVFHPTADGSGLLGSFVGNGRVPVTVDLPAWVRRGRLQSLARTAGLDGGALTSSGDVALTGHCTVATLHTADVRLGLEVRPGRGRTAPVRLPVRILELERRPTGTGAGEDWVLRFESRLDEAAVAALAVLESSPRPLELTVTVAGSTVHAPVALALSQDDVERVRRAGVVLAADDLGARIGGTPAPR